MWKDHYGFGHIFFPDFSFKKYNKVYKVWFAGPSQYLCAFCGINILLDLFCINLFYKSILKSHKIKEKYIYIYFSSELLNRKNRKQTAENHYDYTI